MHRRPKIALETLDIFRELAPAERCALAARCSWQQYGPGATITCQGDVNDDLLVLAAGQARVSVYSASGQEIMLRDVVAGEAFGVVAPVDGEPRTANIVATRRSTVAALPAAALWEILLREPKVAAMLLKRLAGLVRTLSEQIYAVNALTVRERLLAELRRLADDAADGAGPGVIDPAPTHLDMAGRVVAKRETVSREMSQLARAGVIERRGRTLVIPDITRLKTLIAWLAALLGSLARMAEAAPL